MQQMISCWESKSQNFLLTEQSESGFVLEIRFENDADFDPMASREHAFVKAGPQVLAPKETSEAQADPSSEPAGSCIPGE